MNPHTGLGSQAIYVEQNLLYTLATIDENAEYVAAPPEEYPPNAGLPPLGIYRMGYMISSPESYKKWDDSALRPPSCCRSPTKRQRG
jgi:hypothetical protein